MSNVKSNDKPSSLCVLKVTNSVNNSVSSNSYLSNTSISYTSECKSHSKASTNCSTTDNDSSKNSKKYSSSLDNSLSSANCEVNFLKKAKISRKKIILFLKILTLVFLIGFIITCFLILYPFILKNFINRNKN